MEFKKDIKCKVPIVIMLILSIVFIFSKALTSIVVNIGKTVYNNHEIYIFLNNVLLIFSLLFAILPSVLLLIYMTASRKKEKSSVLIFVSFCFYIVLFITTLVGSENFKFYYLIPRRFMYFGGLIYLVVEFISFILLSISTLKGMNNKALVTIGSVIGILAEVLYIILLLDYHFVDHHSVYQHYFDFLSMPLVIISMIGSLGYILFWVAVLVFGINNTIPPLSKKTPNVKKVKPYNKFPKNYGSGYEDYYTVPQQSGSGYEDYYTAPQQPYTGNGQGYNSTPEQSLLTLKDLYDRGIITLQEYEKHRDEIIGKV